MCPTVDELRRFLDDEPGAVDRAAVEAHVQECGPCMKALERLADHGAREVADVLRHQPLDPISSPGTAPVAAPTAGAPTRDAPDAINAVGSLAPSNGSLEPRPLTEGPGTRIGPYTLVHPIGEGGMGVVYLAEQERPVRRKVALKVIKPGMDTAQ